jgi:hypothetical protein
MTGKVEYPMLFNEAHIQGECTTFVNIRSTVTHMTYFALWLYVSLPHPKSITTLYNNSRLVLQVVMPCELIGRYQHLVRTHCLLQRWSPQMHTALQSTRPNMNSSWIKFCLQMRLIFTIMLPPIPEIHILGRMTQYNVTFEADFW